MSDAKRSTRWNPGLLFGRLGANSDPEAWKKMIGDVAVCARLDTLPDPKPRWSALFVSTIFQTVLAALVIALPALFPGKLVRKNAYEAVFVASQTEIALRQAQPAVHAKVVSTPSPTVETLQRQPIAKLTAPTPLVTAEPEPAPVKTDDVLVLNEASAEVKFEAPSSEPANPREPVKVGTLAAGNGAPARGNKPPEQVQTGGFGDPNGLPGDIRDKRASIPRLGVPVLPAGPGYGNGSSGVTGTRGPVASAGFGDGVDISTGSKGSRGTVKPGGFETAVVGSSVAKTQQADVPSAVQPVVILAKPNPVYSDEARRLGLEGEVLVNVIFLASGEVRVLRVTNGLGHGLDEAAIRAAQQIRFKPAVQDGKPVDFLATVYIQFELAF